MSDAAKTTVSAASISPTVEDIWGYLREVLDPEVPAVSVVDLGIVRDVRWADGRVEVDVTPTYSGCPAMREIESSIVAALHARGYDAVSVNMVFSPPWTTDWMSDDAKERLRAYGIAPPGRAEHGALVPLLRRAAPTTCPFCGSGRTDLRSDFGSTACKSLHFCQACRQPFEHFKAI